MYQEITLRAMIWAFTINSLVIFFIISTLISFFSNEKSFRYYSLYIFFITIYIYTKSPFESTLIQKYANSNFFLLNWYLQILYNLSYLGFITYFLNLKVADPKLNKIVLRSSNALLIASICFFIFCLVIENHPLFINSILYLFIPVFLALLFYTFYRISFLEGQLKYFVFA